MNTKEGRLVDRPGSIAALVLVVFLGLSNCSFGQELLNPSFEGQPGFARTPAGWGPLGVASSPDTQPGAWNVSLPASHGLTYLSMVCRGNSIIDSYYWESCMQALDNPLKAGTDYRYSIDLAFAKEFQADIIPFDRSASMRVWGMNSTSQNKELLWESGPVPHTTWKTYDFTAQPKIDMDYLVFEAHYASFPKYNGNILIDNIVYHPPAIALVEEPIEEPIDHQQEVNEFTLKMNESTLPEEINGRPVTVQKTVRLKHNKLKITVWDNRAYDGDIISLFLNDKCILKEFEIGKKRHVIKVDVQLNSTNYLTLYAHNTGRIPPNTAALIISDGIGKYYTTLMSDLDKCSSARLIIGGDDEEVMKRGGEAH